MSSDKTKECSQLMTLKQFEWFKILPNKTPIQFGHSYISGINVLSTPFECIGTRVPGGLYFTQKQYLENFLKDGTVVHAVWFPENDNKLTQEYEKNLFSKTDDTSLTTHLLNHCWFGIKVQLKSIQTIRFYRMQLRVPTIQNY